MMKYRTVYIFYKLTEIKTIKIKIMMKKITVHERKDDSNSKVINHRYG